MQNYTIDAASAELESYARQRKLVATRLRIIRAKARNYTNDPLMCNLMARWNTRDMWVPPRPVAHTLRQELDRQYELVIQPDQTLAQELMSDPYYTNVIELRADTAEYIEALEQMLKALDQLDLEV